jgi:post-segregation antitoxin (ccd killing protein)
LSPVVDVLKDVGLQTDASSLANNPEAEFVRLGGFGTVRELHANVSRLFNEEEQRRFLRERAAQWRREIRLLAVLARTGPAETRATIRAHDEIVTTILPDNPSAPQYLRDVLDELFTKHSELADKIAEQLVETVNVDVPDRNQLMEWAKQDGVAVDRLASVERALEAPRRDRARELEKRAQRLAQRGVRPVPPRGFAEVPTRPPQPPEKGRKEVKPIKVGEGHERQKRKLGDEGERWALAAVVGSLMALDEHARDAAIGEVEALLGRFEGAPVDKALAHAASARTPDLDDEERIDELSNLLHVSQYSDAFGFDLVGWLPPNSNGRGQAICLEVKSNTGEGFHLSQGQWSLAEQLHGEGAGDRYAVLAIRRAKGGGVPAAMDLLSDPVALVKAEHLRREADGYQIIYRTSKS